MPTIREKKRLVAEARIKEFDPEMLRLSGIGEADFADSDSVAKGCGVVNKRGPKKTIQSIRIRKPPKVAQLIAQVCENASSIDVQRFDRREVRREIASMNLA